MTERVERHIINSAAQPVIPPRRRNPRTTHPLGRLLRAYGGADLYAVMPHPDLIEPFDAELARLIRAAIDAEQAETYAARSWELAKPGGADFTAALDAEAEMFRAWHAEQGEVPAVDRQRLTPLTEHMIYEGAVRYRHAWHCQWASDAAHAAVRNHATNALALHERLSAEADEVRDLIGEMLVRARDRADLGALIDAERMAPRWGLSVRLLAWCIYPDRDYRPPLGDQVRPYELALVYWRANEACGRGQGIYVPDIDVSRLPTLTAEQIEAWLPELAELPTRRDAAQARAHMIFGRR